MCVGRERDCVCIRQWKCVGVWGDRVCAGVFGREVYMCGQQGNVWVCVEREIACLYGKEMCGCVEGVCVHGGEMMYVGKILVCVCV